MFAFVKGVLITKGRTEVFAREEAFAFLADTPFGQDGTPYVKVVIRIFV